MKSLSSIVEADVYELVWRRFARTRIHEALLQIWRANLKKWTDSINKGRSLFPTAKLTTWQDLIFDPVFGRSFSRDPLFLGNSPHYHNPNNNHFFYHGFPLPEQGGILRRWGDESRVRIFMDDLSLCPDCGRFHSRDDWPNIPWLDYMERRTDVDAMFEAIERRRNSKEFGHRPCEDREFCEKTAGFFRTKFEQEEESERERLAWAAKVKEIMERPISPPTVPMPEPEQKQSAQVYLIGNNGFVKIGIATNVNKRLSSLQTSSPFPLKLIKSWQCVDAVGMEQRLHRRFTRSRHKGEWFRLSEKTINRLLAVDELDAYFKR